MILRGSLIQSILSIGVEVVMDGFPLMSRRREDTTTAYYTGFFFGIAVDNIKRITLRAVHTCRLVTLLRPSKPAGASRFQELIF
jgi:hypothetical protein